MSMIQIGSPLEIFTRHMFTEVIARLSAFLVDGNFSISEIAALHLIDREEGIFANSLAQKLNLSVSATSRLIAGLEKKGLVKRKENSEDSRVKSLRCSPRGKAFLNELSLERTRAAARVIGALPEAVAHSLISALKNAKENAI